MLGRCSNGWLKSGFEHSYNSKGFLKYNTSLQPNQIAAVSTLTGEPYTQLSTTSATVSTTWTQLSMPGVIATASAAGGAATAMLGYYIDYEVNPNGQPNTLWLDDASWVQIIDLPVVTLTPPARPIPREYFCMNVCHMFDAPVYPWPSVDYGIWRTWDSGITWRLIQSGGRGTYFWEWMDQAAREVRTHV